MTVTGWKLDPEERGRLLERFPPAWPDVIADHITLKSGAAARERLPCETHAEIVGGIDDGEGLQAMVVSIAGTTDRPDGSTYHITWRSEEHASELQSLMRISYAVFCLKKKKNQTTKKRK